MRSIGIIGDVHGKFDEYYRQIKDYQIKESIQIGDMGVGFSSSHDMALDEYLNHLHQDPEASHAFFRGNHDDPAKCNSKDYYMGDWGYNEELDMFWVAGAWSIDKGYRTANVDWWEDEELTDSQWNEVRKAYIEAKPKIVLSHDCPLDLYPTMLGYYGGRIIPTKTSRELAGLLYQHVPEKWFFGHHHQDITHEEWGCEFRCLGELSVYELKIE